MKKYRIYIDETGNSDLNSSENPNHRFLTLTGVVVSFDYVKDTLHPDMEKIKNDILNQHPDDPIIFHRKDIINKKNHFNILKDDVINQKFNKAILDKLNRWDYTIITVLIDKKEHRDLYRTWRYDPYHYCLAVLLERFVFLLEKNNAVGDVMIESRGGKEDMRLKRSFRKLFNDGTQFVKSSEFQKYLTSKEIKVKPKSANIAGLQLADIIAHPSRRQFLLHLKHLSKKRDIFGDKIIEIIKKKYYKKDNKIYGYGMKKLP